MLILAIGFRVIVFPLSFSSVFKFALLILLLSVQFSSVQLLSHVRLFATLWTAVCQAFLPITNSQSLLKLMSIESVMPSNHLILCHPLLFPPSICPSIRIFSNESVLCIRWPNVGISASALVLPMNIQDWFPLGSTGWISLKSKGTLKYLLQHHSVPCQMLYCKQNIQTRRNWNFVASLNFPCESNILTSQKEQRCKVLKHKRLELCLLHHQFS